MKKKIGIASYMCAAILLTGGIARAVPAQSPTVNVTPTLAPNIFGSPSYSGWRDNAIQAVYTGSSTYGDPSLPTYFSAAPASIDVSQNVVTGFPSWQGQADPGTVFGSAFGSELGQR